MEAHSFAAYVIGAVAVGVAMDWAIFERFKITIGPYVNSDEVRYRELPFWRTGLVAVGAATVGVSLSSHPPPGFPF
ncbi:MAG: hypothetical protein OSB00_18810 [Sphingomonas bacterium]|nr:hypothetical protein [Sphingomonas bacterium]